MKTVILHVEDDENDVLFMAQALHSAGVSDPVHVAGNGREAIAYLHGEGRFADRTAFPLPTLILLDLRLPYVPGLEVLRWIREAELMVIVIVLTSSDSETDIADAYRLGATAYLVKPNEIHKLSEIAKSIKDFWITLNYFPHK